MVNGNSDAQMVKRVGACKDAVVQYMLIITFYDRIKDYKWEFNLVDSKDVNAWCMPGGKVVVYSSVTKK